MPRCAAPRPAFSLLFGRMRSRVALAILAALGAGCASMRGVTLDRPKAAAVTPIPHAAGSDRGQPRAWRDIPAQALRDPWRARVAARSRAAPGRGERVLAHGPRPCGRTRALATAPRYRPPLWTRRECPAG